MAYVSEERNGARAPRGVVDGALATLDHHRRCRCRLSMQGKGQAGRGAVVDLMCRRVLPCQL